MSEPEKALSAAPEAPYREITFAGVFLGVIVGVLIRAGYCVRRITW